jgi:hypothetical protein
LVLLASVRQPIGGLVVAERLIMKTQVQQPSGSRNASPLQVIPTEQLKHVAGGVAKPSSPLHGGPTTNPEVSPVL